MPADTPLVTLVSACSLDRAFIDAIVYNARIFSDLVVVSLGTRLHDGRPEDFRGEAERLVKDPEEEENGKGLCAVMVSVYEGVHTDPVALHNMARRAGVEAARRALSAAQPFWALMLDGDEVPDGPAFERWWKGEGGSIVRLDSFMAHKMANLWLFIDPRLASTELEDSVLLVHSDALVHDDALQHPRERDGVYLWNQSSPLGMHAMCVQRNVLSDDKEPMFWHFSWVREGGRDALKAKCAHWGHAGERDWPALIDTAFDAVEHGQWPERDFVHNRGLRLLDQLPEFLGEHLRGLAATHAFLSAKTLS
jgi:hypothetical protein